MNRRATSLSSLAKAIVSDNPSAVEEMLAVDPGLVGHLIEKERLYKSGLYHWIYVGDTALHMASAGYRIDIVRLLLDAGADPNAAHNRRRATPLHYAADVYVTGPAWDAHRQVATLTALLGAEASINAQDRNGASALHRATRTRCADAVLFLLEAGADPSLPNESGSTPFHLAVQTTGRGGSGEPVAKDAQHRIIQAYLSRGVSPDLLDGNGQTVYDCARSDWVRNILHEGAV
jgi:ankyrin repeat protein